MFVVTIDQQGSRRHGDRVEHLLAHLDDGPRRRFVRPLERTVGDEVQGVLDDPVQAVDLALDVLRLGEWYVGVGAGRVDEPLPVSTRAGFGSAFVHARTAVERAKSGGRAVPTAVDGDNPERAAEAEAVLVLLGAVRSRRTEAAWAVVDALGEGPLVQDDVAARLGISELAVSQRLRTALWAPELAIRPLAARLLDEARAPAGA